MLIRFEVSNFRSLLDPVELSMVAVDRERDGVTWVPNIGEGLLPVAGIYGPNASGKTNVIAALDWLRSAVRNSLRDWGDAIPVEPFALGAAGRSTEMTVETVVEDVRYEYMVELGPEAISYEALFHYPERRRRRVFEREGEDLTLQRGFGAAAGTRDLLTPRLLALSAARRLNEPLIAGFTDDLARGLSIGTVSRDQPRFSAASSEHWFEGADTGRVSAEDRRQAVALLQAADLGIDDVEVRHLLSLSKIDPSPRLSVRLFHRSNERNVPLALSQESEGTRTWYTLIGPVLSALQTGSLLLFDELDRSLHPTLCARFVELFQDPVTNPHGAQLVFTAHDTSLLNYLNRDEVWLTEKDERGVTRLGALAEFAGERVRRSQNLERSYLHGRFGALPDVDRAEVLRALGLIG